MSLDTDSEPTKQATQGDPGFVPEDGAAGILNVRPRKLQYLRHNGGGPAYYKFGQLVRYRIVDLLAWADAQRRDSTAA
jgi:hypothetical protein